jgi:hypothetical protein
VTEQNAETATGKKPARQRRRPVNIGSAKPAM